jgi:hypothetical protein
VIPIHLGLQTVHVLRFEVALNSFKLCCCIGWCLIWYFKVYYRKILYSGNWNIQNVIMISLEPIQIILTVISVSFHFDLNTSLSDETLFNSQTRIRFHALAKLHQTTQYLDAFVCLILVFACFQVLRIFRTTRWVLAVMSLATS